VCELGYGKRTPFGPNEQDSGVGIQDSAEEAPEESADASEISREAESAELSADDAETDDRSSMRYRRQRRGGKGLKDVRVTAKNGKVIGTASIRDGDEIMFITMQGMVTRTRVDDIRIVGRNTQGVRIMNLNEGDRLASMAKIAPENVDGETEG